MGLLDRASLPVKFLSFDAVAGETIGPITIRVIGADATLESESNALIKLKARLHGTADPYVDLATGIDLSGFTPDSNVDFDLIVVADAGLTGLVRVGLFCGVVTGTEAGWKA